MTVTTLFHRDIRGLNLISLLLVPSLACSTASAQSPVTRDSSGVRIVANVIRTEAPPAWRVVDPALLVTVGGKAANGKAALSGVRGAVRLGNGNIVVTDADHARLVFFDAHGAFRFGVDVIGAGGQRAYPSALVPVGANEMAQWDGVGNRLTT